MTILGKILNSFTSSSASRTNSSASRISISSSRNSISSSRTSTLQKRDDTSTEVEKAKKSKVNFVINCDYKRRNQIGLFIDQHREAQGWGGRRVEKSNGNQGGGRKASDTESASGFQLKSMKQSYWELCKFGSRSDMGGVIKQIALTLVTGGLYALIGGSYLLVRAAVKRGLQDGRQHFRDQWIKENSESLTQDMRNELLGIRLGEWNEALDFRVNRLGGLARKGLTGEQRLELTGHVVKTLGKGVSVGFVKEQVDRVNSMVRQRGFDFDSSVGQLSSSFKNIPSWGFDKYHGFRLPNSEFEEDSLIEGGLPEDLSVEEDLPVEDYLSDEEDLPDAEDLPDEEYLTDEE